ncbi:MAG TPA: HlyD family secretion protein [Acidobacteriota bacterium]|nr:HlyD family secretion protein [Acidobacteriota bacterium]
MSKIAELEPEIISTYLETTPSVQPVPVKPEAPAVTVKPAPVQDPKSLAGTAFFQRRPVQLGVVALLVVGLLFGARTLVFAHGHESTDDAFIDGTVIPISSKVAGHIAKVYVKDNQTVRKGDLIAEIDDQDFQVKLAQAKAQLAAAQANLRSAQINVDLTSATSGGSLQQASAGVTSAQSQVQTSEALVSAAKARLEQARAQVATAQANLESSRAQLLAAEAESTQAATDAGRYQKLFDAGDTSRQRLDQALTIAQTAAAQVSAARMKVVATEAQVAEAKAQEISAQANLQQTQSQVGGAQAQVGEALGQLTSAQAAPHQVAQQQARAEAAQAAVTNAEAAVKEAELMVSYTKIYAPEDGRITRKAIDPGTYVQVGQSLVALVSNDMWIEANFKETQLTYMRPGQAVEIEIDAYPGKVFKGHVESIQSGTGARFSLLPPENATGNYVKVVQRVPVKIVFDQSPDPQFSLGLGMSVEPEVKVR